MHEQVWLLTFAFDHHAEIDIAFICWYRYNRYQSVQFVHCHMEIIENWGICRDQSFVFSLLEAMQKLDTAEAELSRLRGDLQVRRLRSHWGQNIFNLYGGRWGCYELFHNLWDFRKMTSPLRLRGKTRPWDNRSQLNGCDRGMALNTNFFFDSNGLILWMSP